MAEDCFNGMYSGCTSIKLYEDSTSDHNVLWVVPNITSATKWNFSMFYGCGSDNCCDTTNDGSDVKIGKTYYLSSPALKIATISVTLENNLTMNFKVDKDILDVGYTNPQIAVDFSVKGIQKGATLTEYTESGDYLVFSFKNIEPQYMATNLTATLSATKSGEVVSADGLEYSIKTYCEALIEQEGEETLLSTLCVDILNYGAECQLYEDDKATNLANAGLTAEQKGWATEQRIYTTVLDKSKVASGDRKTRIYCAQMVLGNAITLQVGVMAQDYDDKILRFYKGSTQIGGDIQLNLYDADYQNPNNADKYVLVDFNELCAYELSDTITIKVFDDTKELCSATYSVESYASAKFGITYKPENYDEEGVDGLSDLVVAVMKYGDSAKAYYDAQN